MGTGESLLNFVLDLDLQDFISVKRHGFVRKIDADAKTKWHWDWLEGNKMMEQYIRKLKLCWQAYCTLCNQTLRYQSSGKRDLERHLKSPPHLSKRETVRTKQSP